MSWMTRREASVYLGLNLDTLRTVIKRGDIETVMQGRKEFLCSGSVESYRKVLEERRAIRVKSWEKRGEVF